MLFALFQIADYLLRILGWVIIAQVILSWLIVFNVINLQSDGVRAVIRALERITAPLYRPIRRILPDFGGIDFSPMVLIIIIIFIRSKVLPGILMEVGPTIT